MELESAAKALCSPRASRQQEPGNFRLVDFQDLQLRPPTPLLALGRLSYLLQALMPQLANATGSRTGLPLSLPRARESWKTATTPSRCCDLCRQGKLHAQSPLWTAELNPSQTPEPKEGHGSWLAHQDVFKPSEQAYPRRSLTELRSPFAVMRRMRGPFKHSEKSMT